MAIDLCSETSPRISFSHDLAHTDVVPIEQCKSQSLSSLLNSNFDFDFGVRDSSEHESSSADELFSDGVIRPVQIRKRIAAPKKAHKNQALSPPLQTPSPSPPLPLASLPPLPHPSTAENSKKETLKEIMAASFESEEKPQSKSFWSFKRSCSLNCDNGYKRSLICPFPLLSRSHSTGSVQNPKRTLSSKGSSQKLLSAKSSSSSSSSSSFSSSSSSSSSSSTGSSFYIYPMPQKLSSKKNYGGSYGQGVRISPVLNVPPPYISKGTADLFGLGSFFRNGKDKKNNK